jgi:hypothetical protein
VAFSNGIGRPTICPAVTTWWLQVSVSIPVPSGTKAKMLDVVITKTKLKVGLKGQAPIIDVSGEGPLGRMQVLSQLNREQMNLDGCMCMCRACCAWIS